MKKIFLESEKIPTQPIEANIESTRIAQEDQVSFHTDDIDLPSEEQLWLEKQDKRNAVNMEAPVITESHWHKNDKCTNTFLHTWNHSTEFLAYSSNKMRIRYYLISKKRCLDYL